MEKARSVTADVHILPSYFAIPGFGLIPVNAFVVKAQQPVLVDTGLYQDREAFMEALASVIDPSDLKWLWLTHPDHDHVGSLRPLLDRCPNLRVVTTFLGYGELSLFDPPPPERVYFLNPGEELDVGDRKLVCLKPPAYDNPATTAVYDPQSRALFSSDCFGAVMQTPADEAFAIGPAALKEGQVLWGAVDFPWLHKVDESKLASDLEGIRQLDPVVVLSTHLPPARAILGQLLSNLAEVPRATVFTGPNQVAFEAMIAQMTQGAATPA